MGAKVHCLAFDDHHAFTQGDIDRLDNNTPLVITAKDAVKLRALKLPMPCHVLRVRAVLDERAKRAIGALLDNLPS